MDTPEVRLVEWPGTPTAVIRVPDDLGGVTRPLGRLLDEVWQTVREHGLPPAAT